MKKYIYIKDIDKDTLITNIKKWCYKFDCSVSTILSHFEDVVKEYKGLKFNTIDGSLMVGSEKIIEYSNIGDYKPYSDINDIYCELAHTIFCECSRLERIKNAS